MPVLCEVEGYPTGPGNSAPASRRRTLGRPDQANPTMFGSQCAHTRGWTRRFASATVLGSPSLERVHFSMHWLALFESCASCTGRSKRCPRSAATKLIKNPFRGVKGFSLDLLVLLFLFCIELSGPECCHSSRGRNM